MRFFKWKHEPGRRREPTAEERARFEEMLLEHDLEGALLGALAYAMKLTGKDATAARHLVLRARTALWERCSWDPESAPLQAYLCGVVRSERSNDARAATKEREREVEYLTEVETLEGAHGKSAEEQIVAHEESVAGREEATRGLAELEAHFVETGDEVNLDWIKHSLDGVEDPGEMARLSGRRVEDFYRARDRRVRYVQRVLARKQKQEKT